MQQQVARHADPEKALAAHRTTARQQVQEAEAKRTWDDPQSMLALEEARIRYAQANLALILAGFDRVLANDW